MYYVFIWKFQGEHTTEQFETKLEIYDYQKEELEKKFRELREFVDTKMNEQILLHDRMVMRYRKMKDKCRNYDENFKQMQTENCRIKLITQCLMCNVEKLFSYSSIKKFLTRCDDYKNDFLFVEVSHSDTSISDFLCLLYVDIDFKLRLIRFGTDDVFV